MDLRQLRQFVAVADGLHFGRAAQALAMAQPPLSRAIKALEQELGVMLFERNKRRVLLSDAGCTLLPEAKALLAAAARLVESAHSAAGGESGELRLAFVSIVDYSFMPELLRRYTARFPRVRVTLREATTDVQIEHIRAGSMDAGLLLGPLPSDAADLLDYRELRCESLVLALPATHPRAASAAPVALKGLAGEPFICIPRQVAPRLYDAIIGSCAEAGFSPRIVQEAIQMQTIISLVSAGMGVALVPESIVSLRRTGVAYRRLRASKVALEIGVAWRRDNPSAVVSRFVALAAQSRP